MTRDTPATITKAPIVIVPINGTLTKFIIDSGASVNILDRIDYGNICSKPELQNNSVGIYACGSTQALPVCGFLKVEGSGLKTIVKKSTLNAVDTTISSSYTRLQNLLNTNTAQTLNIIHFVSLSLLSQQHTGSVPFAICRQNWKDF